MGLTLEAAVLCELSLGLMGRVCKRMDYYLSYVGRACYGTQAFRSVMFKNNYIFNWTR